MPNKSPFRGSGHDLEASFQQSLSTHSFLDDDLTSSPNPSSRQPTRTPTPLTPNLSSEGHSPPSINADVRNRPEEQHHSGRQAKKVSFEAEDDEDVDAWDIDDDDPDMPSDLRPPYSRPHEGKVHTPLLYTKHESSLGDRTHDTGQPPSTRRRPNFEERDSHLTAAKETRKRYTYAAFFLVISLISFTVQTETAVYIQHNLKWNKAYAMLYFTHGSWTMLWFLQLLILRLQALSVPWPVFWRRHLTLLHSTAQMIQHQSTSAPYNPRTSSISPWSYIARTVAFVTCALTIAGGSWYVAVDQTTASDLTAIYNCSAFFAYAFSIPLLHERLRWSKVLAVIVAIAGVLVVAYGDSTPGKHGSKSGGGTGGPDSAPDPDDPDDEARNRALGNVIIGIGSVLYGLYEVLYKKLACPPDGTSPGRGMIFANFFGSCIGAFTLCVLWIPLPVLHFTGLEVWEWPTGEQAWMLGISVFCNAVFSGSFLVLISLTSPVLSSVAALLTIFLVALVDQLLPPPLYSPLSKAAIAGGVLIIVAFCVLAWATYAEMGEERRLQMEKGVEMGEEGHEETSDEES